MKARIVNEPALDTFERLLKAARSAYIKAQKAEYYAIQALDAMEIDAADLPTEAPNANNLEEAVSCFLQYGEYSAAEIMAEVRAACRRRDAQTASAVAGDYKKDDRCQSPSEKELAKLAEAELSRLEREIAKAQIDYAKETCADKGLDAQDLKELAARFGSDAMHEDTGDVNRAGVQKKRERCAGDADAEAYIAEKVRERDEFEKEMRRRACIPPRGMAGMKYD